MTSSFRTALIFLFFAESHVIVALPARTAFIFPLEETVATFLLLLLNFTFWLAVLGFTVAFRVTFSPTYKVTFFLFS